MLTLIGMIGRRSDHLSQAGRIGTPSAVHTTYRIASVQLTVRHHLQNCLAPLDPLRGRFNGSAQQPGELF
jgi:hypothetical protein